MRGCGLPLAQECCRHERVDLRVTFHAAKGRRSTGRVGPGMVWAKPGAMKLRQAQAHQTLMARPQGAANSVRGQGLLAVCVVRRGPTKPDGEKASASAVALFGLARRAELAIAGVVPSGRVDDNRARWRVNGAPSDGRRKNNQCDQCSHGDGLC